MSFYRNDTNKAYNLRNSQLTSSSAVGCFRSHTAQTGWEYQDAFVPVEVECRFGEPRRSGSTGSTADRGIKRHEVGDGYRIFRML